MAVPAVAPVAVSVMVAEVIARGVPEITPVAVSRVRSLGRVPAGTA